MTLWRSSKNASIFLTSNDLNLYDLKDRLQSFAILPKHKNRSRALLSTLPQIFACLTKHTTPKTPYHRVLYIPSRVTLVA